MSGAEPSPTILVDDEPEAADAYSLWLEQAYDVRTALRWGRRDGGDHRRHRPGAARPADAGDVGRRGARGDPGGGPRLPGHHDTAVTPDWDILDLPFDDYLCKPVGREDLFAAIEQQIDAVDYHENVSEYFGNTAKQSLLEQRTSPVELENHDRYRQLTERAEELRAEMDEQLEAFDDIDRA